jgi:hypothetical protein
MDHNTRLTIELVPSTCWFTNVRSNVSPATWDRLRRQVAKAAGQRCEICGGRGRRWPVECHEVFSYDDERHVQRLERLVALCPACHSAKHIGHAAIRGGRRQAVAHLAKVNGWTVDDAELYIEAVMEQWAARSRHRWQLDLGHLEKHYGVDLTKEVGGAAP